MNQILQSVRVDDSTSANIDHYGDLNVIDSQEEFRKLFGVKYNIISECATSYNYDNGSKNTKNLLMSYTDRYKLDIFFHIFRQQCVKIITKDLSGKSVHDVCKKLIESPSILIRQTKANKQISR